MMIEAHDILEYASQLLHSDPLALDPLPIAEDGVNVVEELPLCDHDQLFEDDGIVNLLTTFNAGKRDYNATLGEECLSIFLDGAASSISCFNDRTTSSSSSNKRMKFTSATTSSKDGGQPQETTVAAAREDAFSAAEEFEPLPLIQISMFGLENPNHETLYQQQEQQQQQQQQQQPTQGYVQEPDVPSASFPYASSTTATTEAIFCQSRNAQSSKWYAKYYELCDYKKAYGDCLVPHNWQTSVQLAKWVKRQRYQYKLKQQGKHSTMTDERERILTAIGFVWDSHREAWEERLNELKEFKEQNGHCNVPSNYHNRQLSVWVKYQRHQHKLFCKGESSNMTKERKESLTNIGFAWNLRGSC